MKLRKSKLVEIKSLLNPIRLMYFFIDRSEDQQHTNLNGEQFFSKYKLCLTTSMENGLHQVSIETMLKATRDEMISNILMPIDINLKISYLKEILNFYLEREDEIIEGKDGRICSVNEKFIKTDTYQEYYYDEYEELLNNIKSSLRNEIVFVKNEILNLENSRQKKEQLHDFSDLYADLSWEFDKVDLIELAKVLAMSGAIKRANMKLKYTESYELFGRLFNIELKNPEDQLRERAESLDQPNFFEILLETYNKDQKALKIKRESKVPKK